MKIQSPSSNYDIAGDENQFSKTDADSEDVLADSITNLYSATKSFEIELQKLKDVGNEKHESMNIETSLNGLNDLNSDACLQNLKIEIEETMRQKMEAEVQFIAISKAVECFEVQRGMMVEQKKVVAEQMEMMKKVEDAELKAMELRIQAEKLQVTCEDILEKEEVWEVRNMVCGLTLVFCVQLILVGLLVFLICF
ncbi:hypothetical protein SSX86_000479 [Deinandra increscens subsp. villosa]|uniref:Uncharacterized protein n=1 Tax=Deinandra increscens subsp. villosa TaxID=3103831 RepID=A0AAP0DTF7_9ASTR